MKKKSPLSERTNSHRASWFNSPDLPASSPPSITQAYFNIRPTSVFSPKYAFQYPFPAEPVIFFLFWFWFVFFSMPSFCNSLSGISARMKRGMHRAHLRCGPYNNVFLLHVGRIVPALTHLAPHPYPYPLSLRLKKKSIGPRAFPFSRPRRASRAVIAYLEIQRVTPAR